VSFSFYETNQENSSSAQESGVLAGPFNDPVPESILGAKKLMIGSCVSDLPTPPSRKGLLLSPSSGAFTASRFRGLFVWRPDLQLLPFR
jgi:hypothetical protein